MTRRTFLFAVPTLLAPEPVYLVCGYNASGRWACEIVGTQGLRRARASLAVGSVQTWVSASRGNDRRWEPLD